MKKKYKTYLRLNIISLVFIVSSFIFTTLAWFAYSGLSEVSTEIDVKSWYIELTKSGQPASNNIIITSDIYPGMETVNEKINIKNLGDSDAQLSYEIVSARILDNPNDYFVIDDNLSSEYVEDILSHDYPFHININLSKNYILTGGDESTFEVSVSWPLDSGNDSLDSKWGMMAYQFQKDESALESNDNSYTSRPAIQVVISVTAEQYVESNESSDMNYNFGDTILFDVVNNKKCEELSSTCLKTTIIDKNNKAGDTTVNLLPSLYENYPSGKYSDYNNLYNDLITSWNVETKPLELNDLLLIISNDITQSYLVGENISDIIIGRFHTQDRINHEIEQAINLNGYYTFQNNKFSYMVSNSCYWTNKKYDDLNSFALRKQDEVISKIYPESIETECRIVPIIIASKEVLQSE